MSPAAFCRSREPRRVRAGTGECTVSVTGSAGRNVISKATTSSTKTTTSGNSSRRGDSRQKRLERIELVTDTFEQFTALKESIDSA